MINNREPGGVYNNLLSQKLYYGVSYINVHIFNISESIAFLICIYIIHIIFI